MADEVHKVVRALGIGRFALAGHSMGGMVAQQYCLEHPNDLSCLFLCCTAARGNLLSKTTFNLDGVRRDIQEKGMVEAMAADPYSAFAPGYDTPLVKEYMEMEYSTDGATGIKCLDAMEKWALDKDLAAKYLGPVVIICGESDRITPPSFAPELKGAFSGSTVEMIRGAGHMVFLEQPGEFRSLVVRHLG